jgi:glycosyltransferase involved in cell wall biosynthesis
MPKVSVIVPVYKVENYIRKCVDSIRNQTLTDIEIILVDDGSPDQCGKICNEYREKDPRIKVIHKKNGGISDARNAGLEIVTGDYIGFVDSDDYVSPTMFEVLYSLCVENYTMISGCDLAYVYDGDDEKFCEHSSENVYVLSSSDFYSKMLDVQDYVRSGVWNKLYKRELFKGVKFPNAAIAEDVGTVYKVIFKTDKISYISKPMYYYLKQRIGSLTNQKYSSKEYDRIRMNNEMVEYIKNNQPELLITVMGFRAVNCHLSVLNIMIKSGVNDKQTISLLQKELRSNMKYIIKSNQSIIKKVQVIIASYIFQLYKLIIKRRKS